MPKKMRLLGWFLGIAFSGPVFAWGPVGHRIVGEIAQRHVRRGTLKKIQALLGPDSLARVANWADEERSNPARDAWKPWHYVTIEDGLGYSSAPKNPQGDVIAAIARLEGRLGNRDAPRSERAEALKLLVHFIGDIHQPLHVGRGADQGGNGVRVRFFGVNTNLHAVWDSGLIDNEKLSFTEFTNFIDHASAAEIEAWQKASVEDWARESIELRPLVYGFEGKPAAARESAAASEAPPELGYDYRYRVIAPLERRLLQAGLRLAGRLDAILK